MQESALSTTLRLRDAAAPAPPGVPAPQPPDSGIAEVSLRIAGMHCAACAHTIEAALHAVPGLLSARVSAAGGHGSVRFDRARTSLERLQQAVAAAGYSASVDRGGSARLARQREARLALWRLFVAAFCAMQVMMFATPAYVSAPGELAPDLQRLLAWGGWLLTLPVMGFAATPFFAGAWRALRSRRIGMDVPVSLGIAVAFVASSGAAFDPGGPFGHEVYFDSLTMFVAFLLGGRWLEMRARHRAEAALETATARLPERVLRLRADGGADEVDLDAVRPGDTLRVPLGQAFAADGVVVEGRTEADESLLTGESRPVAKGSGDAVIAGSINRSAPVLMRVERVGADTRYAAIVALMRSARSQRPASLGVSDRWAAAFLWAVLALAAAAGLVWHAIEPSRAVWVVVSVLIVTCPCALSLAMPAALVAAAGAMGRRGVVLRRLDAIDALARADTLFIDKTGTLTESQLECVAVEPLAPDDGDATPSLLVHAASLAGWSHHPLAQAVARSVPLSPVAPAVAWRDVREVPGHGIEAVDAQGRRWRLGAPRWAGTTHGERDTDAPQVVLGREGVALLRLRFDEVLRTGAAAAVSALRGDGLRVHLLSGDNPRQAQRLARRLALDSARAGLLPEDKLAAVQAARARGEVVAMVGDGINDAPVLAGADVSFAMGEGAAVARSQADAVLVSNRLQDLHAARVLARRTMRVARQNLAWACAYNAACVPLALGGLLPPWLAGLGMASSSLLVVLNALRLAR
ncbi:MAG TPA: cation-translocating P-type ATPase [Burkholderiaceae bacterium]|nr:cation-translocating P-type ATPase [Burkholderiaceae bacterium]